MKTSKSAPSDKHDIVQLKNPKTERYVKIDRTVGVIVSEKKRLVLIRIFL